MHLRLLLLGIAALFISGCATTRHGVSSSLVDFLYPNGQQPPPVSKTVPHLDVPVRVGIAFVPPRYPTNETLTEAHQVELLNNVKQAFADRDFISTIEVIPEAYLRSSRGFGTIDQVARLYQIDVMALVSYDQVSVTEDTKASLAYWTIVGAYLIPGSRSETQTFVDTAVFDVKTHALLFRAAGTHASAKTSTLVDAPQVVRQQGTASFDAAMADMTKNLATALDAFRDRVKNEQVVTVSQHSGASGSSDWLVVILLLTLAGRRRRSG